MRNLLPIFALLCVLSCPLLAQNTQTSKRANTSAELARNIGSVSFAGENFRDALNAVALKTDAKVAVDWSELARQCGILPECKVTFSGENLTVAQCLDLLLARVERSKQVHRRGAAAWYANTGGIVVSSRAMVLGSSRKAFESLPRTDDDGKKAQAGSQPEMSQSKNLSQRYNLAVEFDNRPASEVMEFFKQAFAAQGIKNFIVRWPALEAIGIDQDTPVTLKLNSRIGIWRAADLATEAMSPTSDPLMRAWLVNDGGVFVVTSGQQLNTRVSTHSWYIGDVMLGRPNFRAPTVGIETREAGDTGDSNRFDDNGEDNNTATIAQQRQAMIDSLTASITESIDPQYWQPQGKGSVRIFKGLLLITQTELGFKLLEKATGLN